MSEKIKIYNCKMCLEGELSELKVFNDLKRVTSDCKPFEKGGRLFICKTCGGLQKYLMING